MTDLRLVEPTCEACGRAPASWRQDYQANLCDRHAGVRSYDPQSAQVTRLGLSDFVRGLAAVAVITPFLMWFYLMDWIQGAMGDSYVRGRVN